MWIEAVQEPVRCRWAGGEIRLEPGKPMDLPEDRAKKLLEKASGKVRVVPDGMCEPALTCRLVYWQSMNGQVHGPATVRFIARTGVPGRYQFWLCVEAPGRTVWIRDDRLRSRPVAAPLTQEAHGR